MSQESMTRSSVEKDWFGLSPAGAAYQLLLGLVGLILIYFFFKF
jgi:hypothetical protein